MSVLKQKASTGFTPTSGDRASKPLPEHINCVSIAPVSAGTPQLDMQRQHDLSVYNLLITDAVASVSISENVAHVDGGKALALMAVTKNTATVTGLPSGARVKAWAYGTNATSSGAVSVPVEIRVP